MPTSVRLDSKTEAMVRRLAQRTHRTKSAVIREALERLARDEQDFRTTPGPYGSIADLIGIASGGPPDLARRSGQAFRQLLVARGRRQ
jgi:hypothetical protein